MSCSWEQNIGGSVWLNHEYQGSKGTIEDCFSWSSHNKLRALVGERAKFSDLPAVSKILETKDAPYAFYISQLMNAKLKHILSNLNDILNVKSSRATSQLGGEEGVFPEVNINNPYQTGLI